MVTIIGGITEFERETAPEPARRTATNIAYIEVSPAAAPLHGLHAPGIAAAGDDAEIGARLLQCGRVDVGLRGSPWW
jgi:hypothetical protein